MFQNGKRNIKQLPVKCVLFLCSKNTNSHDITNYPHASNNKQEDPLHEILEHLYLTHPDHGCYRTEHLCLSWTFYSHERLSVSLSYFKNWKKSMSWIPLNKINITWPFSVLYRLLKNTGYFNLHYYLFVDNLTYPPESGLPNFRR